MAVTKAPARSRAKPEPQTKPKAAKPKAAKPAAAKPKAAKPKTGKPEAKAAPKLKSRAPAKPAKPAKPLAAARTAARRTASPKVKAMVKTRREPVEDTVARLLALVRHSLDEDKAEDVVVVDLAGKSAIADYMVVAQGRSQRQVGAIADHLARRLKDAGHAGPVRVEGMPQNDWVLVDAGDIIVHVFRPEVRGFYKLEQMWSLDFTGLDEGAAAPGA